MSLQIRGLFARTMGHSSVHRSVRHRSREANLPRRAATRKTKLTNRSAFRRLHDALSLPKLPRPQSVESLFAMGALPATSKRRAGCRLFGRALRHNAGCEHYIADDLDRNGIEESITLTQLPHVKQEAKPVEEQAVTEAQAIRNYLAEHGKFVKRAQAFLSMVGRTYRLIK